MNDRYLDEAVAVTASGKRVPILTHTCRGFLERFCGLMLKREVPEACGLYFPGCRSIHTCMMRVPIDVVWVREGEPGELKAVSLDVSLKPWRFFAAPRGATGCVEFRRVVRPRGQAGRDRAPEEEEIGDHARDAAVCLCRQAAFGYRARFAFAFSMGGGMEGPHPSRRAAGCGKRLAAGFGGTGYESKGACRGGRPHTGLGEQVRQRRAAAVACHDRRDVARPRGRTVGHHRNLLRSGAG